MRIIFNKDHLCKIKTEEIGKEVLDNFQKTFSILEEKEIKESFHEIDDRIIEFRSEKKTLTSKKDFNDPSVGKKILAGFPRIYKRYLISAN